MAIRRYMFFPSLSVCPTKAIVQWEPWALKQHSLGVPPSWTNPFFGRTQEVIFVISSVISSEHQISQQSAGRCATNMPQNIHQQSLIHKWIQNDTNPMTDPWCCYICLGGILMVNVTIYSIHGSYGNGMNDLRREGKSNHATPSTSLGEQRMTKHQQPGLGTDLLYHWGRPVSSTLQA